MNKPTIESLMESLNIEQEYSKKIKTDLIYQTNLNEQLKKELAEKDTKILKLETQIKDLSTQLSKLSEKYKTEKKEYEERIQKLEEILSPEQEEIEEESGIIKVLNNLGITIKTVES